jgi:hypothetical protein
MPTVGEAWISGSYIHFIDGSGTEWRYEGVDEGTPPSGESPGEIWLSNNTVHYVDESGTHREMGSNQIDASTAETRGSI